MSRRFWSTPKLFPQQTIVCLAPGPTLSKIDLSRFDGVPTIAVSGAFFRYPQANFSYFGDYRFWRWYKDRYSDDYAGRIVTAAAASQFQDGRVLRVSRAYDTPLSLDPTSVAGLDSGSQGINLAFHMCGPGSRIVLAGYDMGFDPITGASHCHEDHPEPSKEESYKLAFAPQYADLMASLMRQGVELVRVTPSALEFIPELTIEEALA